MRVKEIGGKRYAYLVEGVREGSRVKQKVLCYLGPMGEIAYGVPEETMRKVEKRWKLDRQEVNDAIKRIPLTFEELSEARGSRYAAAIKARRGGFLTQGTRERAKEEEDALSILAASSFSRTFEKVGERRYRMKWRNTQA